MKLPQSNQGVTGFNFNVIKIPEIIILIFNLSVFYVLYNPRISYIKIGKRKYFFDQKV